MTLTTRALSALLLASVALPAAAQDAEEMMFMAELTGEAEVPPVETGGMGMASATVDTEAMTITWMLAYENLSGEPVAAHIHAPAGPEETAPPVIDLTTDMDDMGGEASAEATATATTTTDEGTETETATASDTTEEPVAQDIMMGSSELTPEVLTALQDGMAYFNVHTEMHPEGEIRGQIMMGEADMEAMEAMMGTMGADAMATEGGDAMEAEGGDAMEAEGGDAMEAEGGDAAAEGGAAAEGEGYSEGETETEGN